MSLWPIWGAILLPFLMGLPTSPRRTSMPVSSAVITGGAGISAGTRPVTISRVFAKGEIANFALASRNGEIIPSQCDVKTRWPDQSVQHALISFQVKVEANAKTTVDFVNSAAPCHLGSQEECERASLDQAAMLAHRSGDWDATVQATAGDAQAKVSAREMLESGAWRYWLRGPIATQVIIEDTAEESRFDFGFKDRRTTVVPARILVGDTRIPLVDASEIANQTLPVKVKINSEVMSVCAVESNVAMIGSSACPNLDGRGMDGTTRRAHPVGGIVWIGGSMDEVAGVDRTLGYVPYNNNRGMTSSVNTLKLYSGEFSAMVKPPYRIRIEDEEINVCGYLPTDRTLQFGDDSGTCPNNAGRGVNGTKAAAHPDNAPITSSAWPASWIEAPSAQYRSIHPQFVATFYHGWNGVKFDVILENAWTGRLQDQEYLLRVATGANSANTQQEERVHHRGLTRLRKVVWDGDAPPAVHVDPNFAYLMHSQVLPNYDPEIRIPASVVDSYVKRSQESPWQTPNGWGLFNPTMPTPGGRGELGLFTSWDVIYLYSADPRLYDVMLSSGVVSGHVPVHFRESDGRRFFDSEQKVPAHAMPVTTYGRRNLITRAFLSGQAADNAGVVGMLSNLPRVGDDARRVDNWNVDLAHQPSFAYVPYLLTGDWYFLQELYFWASYNLLIADPGGCHYCRSGSWGVVNDAAAETRGLAWALRNVAHAAFFAPDSTPEKSYYSEQLGINLALREGVMDIREGVFFDESPDSYWSWGRKVMGQGVSNPLMFPRKALGILTSSSPSAPCATDAPWQMNLNYVVWSHLSELGFDQVNGLLMHGTKAFLHQTLDPEYQPNALAFAYYIPTRRPASKCEDSEPMASWGEVAQAVSASEIASCLQKVKVGIADPDFGYTAIAQGTAAMIAHVSDGQLRGLDAYTWMKSTLPQQANFATNPKWAFVPRASTADLGAGLEAAKARYQAAAAQKKNPE